MSMKKTLILFDVDGTLTVPRKEATPKMHETLKKLREHYTIGVVGGSDLVKQEEQLGRDLLKNFDYVFSENGLKAFYEGKEFHIMSLVNYLGNDTLKKFVKKTLHLIADLDIPVQRGTFIELRAGMMNISPIGRNCSQSERDEFEKYDEVHHVRAKLIADLQAAFPDLPLKYSVGGQISFDVFPIGWDKTYCLQFVKDKFDVIHFFGDKTYEGGNDYEIFTSELTVGHSVKTFNDTIEILERDFLAKV
jgi:phosphomannomutase